MVKLTGEYFEVEARPGDRWDLLAYDHYGNVKYQSIIIKANIEAYTNSQTKLPLILKAGTKIIIPIIEDDEIDESLLPPWKRNNPDYGENDGVS